MASRKVAVITGGASGIGLTVATLLSRRPEWSIHILDLPTSAGPRTAPAIGATFHACDVTLDASLSAVFKAIFAQTARVDFVFANAGIAEHSNFYADQSDAEDPELPIRGINILDINLKAVVATSYLALHYFRKSPESVDKSLLCTASCAAFYPSHYAPMYTAAKHGVLGFARAITPTFFKSGVRVNCLCPSTVKTGLLTQEEWDMFPGIEYTRAEKVGEVVLMMIDGKDDGKAVFGKEIGEEEREKLKVGKLTGRAIEVSGEVYYYRGLIEYCDEGMRTVMGSTDIY